MKQKSRIFAIKQEKMNTAELKADLHNLIEKTDDISILEALRTLLRKQFASDKAKTDFWDELPETVKKEIDEALKDSKAGNVYTHEEVTREMKKKYNIEL